MSTLAEILISGFLISSLYALVAVGFTMIFGVAGVMNLAHGAFVMVGAYIAIWAATMMGWNIYLAFSLAIIGMALFAPLVYRLLVRPISKRPVIVFLITLLLAVLLEQTMALLFSTTPRILPRLVTGDIYLLGINISYNRIVASLIAVGIIGLLWFTVQRTKTGQAILALSMNRKGAALVGIRAERITLLVWAISGALAAVAGLFSASFLGISPLGDRLPLVIAFSAVVLGGLGSIPGSLWAAFIIGYAETITAQFFPEARGLVSLFILIVILTIRPQGLLGREIA
ncbi:MAG TPA: branched-chain amino acid ABC transporter permease [Candidatus Fraserbacteria bacterium]|nr:branched-chain amino acid ABC transporter permease [Candidatus Fraserbacteria bacterium]